MRSTTRHILLPASDAGRAELLKVKRELRTAVSERGEFVVDAFDAAARARSLDDESAARGGLLGEVYRSYLSFFPEQRTFTVGGDG